MRDAIRPRNVFLTWRSMPSPYWTWPAPTSTTTMAFGSSSARSGWTAWKPMVASHVHCASSIDCQAFSSMPAWKPDGPKDALKRRMCSAFFESISVGTCAASSGVQTLEAFVAHRRDDLAGSVDRDERQPAVARVEKDVAVVEPVVAPAPVPARGLEERVLGQLPGDPVVERGLRRCRDTSRGRPSRAGPRGRAPRGRATRSCATPCRCGSPPPEGGARPRAASAAPRAGSTLPWPSR